MWKIYGLNPRFSPHQKRMMLTIICVNDDINKAFRLDPFYGILKIYMYGCILRKIAFSTIKTHPPICIHKIHLYISTRINASRIVLNLMPKLQTFMLQSITSLKQHKIKSQYVKSKSARHEIQSFIKPDNYTNQYCHVMHQWSDNPPD